MSNNTTVANHNTTTHSSYSSLESSNTITEFRMDPPTFSLYQEVDESEDLWGLLREDIIEINKSDEESWLEPSGDKTINNISVHQTTSSVVVSSLDRSPQQNIKSVPQHHHVTQVAASLVRPHLVSLHATSSNSPLYSLIPGNVPAAGAIPQHSLDLSSSFAGFSRTTNIEGPQQRSKVSRTDGGGDTSTNSSTVRFETSRDGTRRRTNPRNTSSNNTYRLASSMDEEEHTPDTPDRWGARYNDLLEYRRKYGDCNVPYNCTESPLLYSWVKRQRYQYKCFLQAKQSQLTLERIQFLEQVDFAWDTHDNAWEANYKQLEEFVKLHKHCHVPAKETRLFAWMKRQRRKHKLWIANEASTMTEDRYQRLTLLGFRWGSNTKGHQSP